MEAARWWHLPTFCQSLYIFVQFDISETERGDLRLTWTHSGVNVRMSAVPHPPEHESDEDDTPVDWPENVKLLPPGDSESGRRLYAARYGCAACHGHPASPGTETVGPHLGMIGADAFDRVPGQSAAAYIYESILNPKAFVASNCGDRPCSSSSSMPPFGTLMNPQAMADVMAYLLQQQGGGAH